jgi:hypothetical protein
MTSIRNASDIRTYTKLLTFNTFEDRYAYLKLDGVVGKDTFGPYRYLYQDFLHSTEWRKIQREVLVRDRGLDLGCEGYEIYGKIFLHHLNPICPEDILDRTEYLLNPEYIISTSKHTHDMIHYGMPGDSAYPVLVERKKNDTIPWRC